MEWENERSECGCINAKCPWFDTAYEQNCNGEIHGEPAVVNCHDYYPDRWTALEAQNAKLRSAIEKHLEKCKTISPRHWVYFGFGELHKALTETEKP